MTAAERVQAVVDYGFTEREARFLVLVMRHSGLCVKRQYAAFAGIANGGDRCNALFAKLVRRRFATAVDCIHNRARLYHVHHKPLYHVIGEPDNRYRRTVPARAAAERLVRLDAALIDPELDWLTTPPEKVDRLPASPPTPFPTGIDAAGRPVFVYIAMKPWTDDFRSFLCAHVPLLAVTPTWTLRIVFPRALHRVVPEYQRAVYEELENRLDEQTMNELLWYFYHCRRTDWRDYKGPGSDGIKKRFDACAQAFKSQRFTRLYRLWLADENTALAHSAGRFGGVRHRPSAPRLRRLAARLRSLLTPGEPSSFRTEHVTADAEEGDETPHTINRFLNRVVNWVPR